MKIVTSGCKYIDIDAYGGIIAYAYLLNLKGIPAKAVSTSPLNESITPTLLNLDIKLDKYEKSNDDEFIIVDVSNKDFIIDSESEDVQWVIDMLSEKRIITNKGGRIRVVDEDKLKQLDDIIHATTRNLEDLSEKRAIAGIEIDDDENKEEKNDDEITM